VGCDAVSEDLAASFFPEDRGKKLLRNVSILARQNPEDGELNLHRRENLIISHLLQDLMALTHWDLNIHEIL
jgi:hypothetical protein